MSPKEYLSYSQLMLWIQSPDRYIEKYIYNAEQFETKEMRYGKMLSEALEKGTLTSDPVLNNLIPQIPKFEVPEMEFLAKLKFDKKEFVPLFGKMDSAMKDLSAFKEYKTGKNHWNQRRVDDDQQITFYVTALFILTGKIPTDIELVWIPTKDDPESEHGISAVGEIISYKTTRRMSHIVNEMALMKRVWKDIQARTEKEIV